MVLKCREPFKTISYHPMSEILLKRTKIDISHPSVQSMDCWDHFGSYKQTCTLAFGITTKPKVCAGKSTGDDCILGNRGGNFVSLNIFSGVPFNKTVLKHKKIQQFIFQRFCILVHLEQILNNLLHGAFTQSFRHDKLLSKPVYL